MFLCLNCLRVVLLPIALLLKCVAGVHVIPHASKTHKITKNIVYSRHKSSEKEYICDIFQYGTSKKEFINTDSFVCFGCVCAV